MAAEALTRRGIAVDLYDAMPSLGRKFLMAGKSGLNLTHAEPVDKLLAHFGGAQRDLENAIEHFPPNAVREWAAALGTKTFVGTSGHVFPKSMKAAPLLRAWIRDLKARGLTVYVRHKWSGWDEDGSLIFDTPGGTKRVNPDATILALGGASWPQLGSDASWVQSVKELGVDVQLFEAANCGFNVAWSDHFKERFAGEPVKAIALTADDVRLNGECVVTEYGIEGSGIYQHARALRNIIKEKGEATLRLDLMPDVSLDKVIARLAKPRGSKSLSTHLKKTVFLSGAKANLLRECAPDRLDDMEKLGEAIKSLPIKLTSARPIEEAISSAGGVPFEALDDEFMLTSRPGTFCTGEMLNWEAPTGGYLLNACMALGRSCGVAVANYLKSR
ncbi:MAG: TIGR03862 family flavoprotein [Rhodobiaceae bacterium]|nr:TIGR03862 family flavoprotein [Rhodobiaceae bacterium]